MRKVWYHQIWIQNYFGFIVSDLTYISFRQPKFFFSFKSYFKEPWNIFDLITVLGSIVDALMVEFAVKRLLYKLFVLGGTFKSITNVSFFGLCSKMQIIPIKKLNIKTCFIQFLWVFWLKCWFKGQMISRTHLGLPNECKLMCFDRNINGNKDVKFLIGIIVHCTDQRNLLYIIYLWIQMSVLVGAKIRGQ